MAEDISNTLRRAVEGEPNASWTDAGGQLWKTDEVLSEWNGPDLDQPVTWAEGRMGMPAIRGRDGKIVLTMIPPTGQDILPEPVVPPES